jgi:5-guanidino-2-oxopentanoate decarboxylase
VSTIPPTISCGEALIALLERYGVDTVFGIPGVHTLDIYRGLANSTIRHIQARNEQGAGFMADGYARLSGQPGVCILISGPGVTNACTPMGQSFADSIPVLVISSTTARNSLGKGWGCLHEVTDLESVTRPLTALSATASSVDEIEGLIGQAFSIFSSERPRPVHIAIPIDVLASPVTDPWQKRVGPARPAPNLLEIRKAAAMLRQANRPLIYVGGGAVSTTSVLTKIAECLDAAVLTTTAGKGVVPDSHPLCIGASLIHPLAQEFLAKADVILAIGTELSETEGLKGPMPLNGQLIRIDIDSRKINDRYPPAVGIVGDAKIAAQELLVEFGEKIQNHGTADEVSDVCDSLVDRLTESESQHIRMLNVLRGTLPDEAVIFGDICQVVYTGAFAYPVEHPRQWNYAAGYGTLGCALPNAIGGKLAVGDTPVVVLVGDGGFMFTVQELITAAELQFALPIIIWNNAGLKQIRDDMLQRNIPLVGVDGINPNFDQLAEACGCQFVRPDSEIEFRSAVTKALKADSPMLIEVYENSAWLR